MIRLRVKEIAQAQGLSQAKLQRKADMDIKTIRKIFRDPTAPISTETLGRLAIALEVSPGELLEVVPDNSTASS